MNEFTARITYYTNDPKWGNKVAWSRQGHAVKGETVAAPSRLKFGTRLSIPQLKGKVGDGEFVVHDRGPAVERGTASGGKLPVIDVYVSSHAEVNRLKVSMPRNMRVIVSNG